MKNYVLSLAAGTTSSRAILLDKRGNPVTVAQDESTQFFPKKKLGRTRSNSNLGNAVKGY